MIKNRIEITRDFALKAVKLSGVNYKPISKQFVEFGEDLNVSVDVKVWDDSGEITETGGCSMSEVKKRQSQHSFNDMVTTATTRAMKRALEAKTGLPFVNLLILELFGGYSLKEEKKTTATVTDVENDKAGNDVQAEKAAELKEKLFQKLKKSAQTGIMTKDARDNWWLRIKSNTGKLGVLENFEKQIDATIDKAIGNDNS